MSNIDSPKASGNHFLSLSLVDTKPRRGEKFSGGEFLGRGIFPRQFGRGGFGGENLKNFPARGGSGEDFRKTFPRRGRSGEDFLAKTYKFLAKSTNSSPKYTKMSQFPAMARKKSKFSPPGQGWREKSQVFPRPGSHGGEKFQFLTRGILATPRPSSQYPAK